MAQLPILLSYLMVVMALAISAAVTLKQMVRLYRAQALVLTAVVLLTALDAAPDEPRLAVALLALLPATLAVVVPPLLARASLARAADSTRPDSTRPARAGFGPRARLATLRDSLRDAPARADLTWLQHGHSRLSRGLSAVIEMMLIGTAVLVAYRLARGTGAGSGALSEEVTSLAVTLALLLQGLFTMGNKRDIIAQIIGLLVMEHGLFLAAVRIAPLELVLLFMMSLFFYAMVTLTILLWILPELHRASNSIEVADNSRLKG